MKTSEDSWLGLSGSCRCGKRPGSLPARAMVSAIMNATSGITGHISELLSRAAEVAIRSKKECITAELLQSVIGAR